MMLKQLGGGGGNEQPYHSVSAKKWIALKNTDTFLMGEGQRSIIRGFRFSGGVFEPNRREKLGMRVHAI
jgi:hypothetical protein